MIFTQSGLRSVLVERCLRLGDDPFQVGRLHGIEQGDPVLFEVIEVERASRPLRDDRQL